jgi:hypothetical protein
MRPFLVLLIVAVFPASAVAKETARGLPAPMHDARFALRIDSTPTPAATRFALDGSFAPTPPVAAPRERFTMSLPTHAKGAGACSAGAQLFKNGFEN